MHGTPLRKMLAGAEELAPAPDGTRRSRVRYALHIGGAAVPLADRIGREFTLRFTGARSCTACGARVRKLYGQGFCWPCLSAAPSASECIVRPELCRAHLDEGRDVQWEHDHHLQEHAVYLSQTGGIKVGVTRSTQVPVRWIDQGAVLAVAVARMPYRQLAGAMEVDLKRLFADRTDWRRMLQQVRPDREALLAARDRVLREVDPALRAHLLPEADPQLLDYPLAETPPRLVNVSLEKLPEITGTLAGIKGQYLVWKDGRVLNVRNHSGFHVELSGS